MDHKRVRVATIALGIDANIMDDEAILDIKRSDNGWLVLIAPKGSYPILPCADDRDTQNQPD